MELQLIHYGATQYAPDKVMPVSDVPFRNKPTGGLWTSPINAKYGWREWCTNESYSDLTESFEVVFNGTVLLIDSVKDMELLPWIECDGRCFVSFQALCPLDFTYDAIYLTEKGERETRFTDGKSLYGWDCETVFVMNPESIRAI